MKYFIVTLMLTILSMYAIIDYQVDRNIKTVNTVDVLKSKLSQSNRTINLLENHYTQPESFPYLWPIVEDDYTKEGRMTSYYGYRNNPLRANTGAVDMKDHMAIDVVGVEGARVQSVGAGTVIHKWYPRGWHNGGWYNGHPDFNGYVEILLDTGFITKNGHVYDITVHEGDRVAPRQVIGRINPVTDDKSTGPHLHFGMLNPWGHPVQPLKFVGTP